MKNYIYNNNFSFDMYCFKANWKEIIDEVVFENLTNKEFHIWENL